MTEVFIARHKRKFLAICWDGSNFNAVSNFLPKNIRIGRSKGGVLIINRPNCLSIIMNIDDYVVYDEHKEFKILNSWEFHNQYEYDTTEQPPKKKRYGLRFFGL